MQKGTKTRLISHQILFKIRENNINFDEAFDINILQHKMLESDKKMIHNIVLSSMRYHLHIEKIIPMYAKKKVTTNQYILLLSAITQIIFLNFKNYAVVNSSVDVAKIIKIFPGFINAILKNIIKDKEKLRGIKIDYNDLPDWFIKKNKDLSKKEKELFLNTIIEKPSLHLVFKNKSCINKFRYEHIKSSDVSLVIKKQALIKNLPRYLEGEWWVQDYAVMLPIYLMENINNKKIIDMCSAPGGKSFQILSLNNNIKLIEINKTRALILQENLNRLNFKTTIDITNSLEISELQKYDIVIIDAPCSSIGTIRRNPEIFFRNQNPNLNEKLLLQKKLLDKAKKIIKKKGVIIYMVCSFFPSETTEQVKKFLKENTNFELSKFKTKDEDDELIDSNGCINILPKVYRDFNIDGFFAAKLINND